MGEKAELLGSQSSDPSQKSRPEYYRINCIPKRAVWFLLLMFSVLNPERQSIKKWESINTNNKKYILKLNYDSTLLVHSICIKDSLRFENQTLFIPHPTPMKWCKGTAPFHWLEKVRDSISEHTCALQVALHATLEKNGHTASYFWFVFQGDSGGPLICAGQYCGFASFGDECENRSISGFYMLLTEKYIDWIKRPFLVTEIHETVKSTLINIVL